MPINSKQKGNSGEREIANILCKYGYESRRGHQFNGQTDEADVIGIEDMHIEVKRVEKLNVEIAMQQSERDARAGEMPVVMHRRNRELWKVTLRLDDFMELWQDHEKIKKIKNRVDKEKEKYKEIIELQEKIKKEKENKKIKKNIEEEKENW